MIQLCTLVIFLCFKFLLSCLLFDLRLRFVAYTVLNGLGDAFIFPEFEHHFFFKLLFPKTFFSSFFSSNNTFVTLNEFEKRKIAKIQLFLRPNVE